MPRFTAQIARTAVGLLFAGGVANAQETRGIIIPPPQPDLSLTFDMSAITTASRWEIVATLQNDGEGTATSPNVVLGVPDGFTVIGPDVQYADPLVPGASAEFEFEIESSCAPEIFNFGLSGRNGEVNHGGFVVLFSNEATELVHATPVLHDEPERMYEFDTVEYDWSVVGVRPRTHGVTLGLNALACGFEHAESDASGLGTEFVLVNGNSVGASTWAAPLTGNVWGQGYYAEHRRAIDIAPGQYGSTITGNHVVDLFEVATVPGTRYRVSLTEHTDFGAAVLGVFEPTVAFASRTEGGLVSSPEGVADPAPIEFFGAAGQTAIVVARQGVLNIDYTLDVEFICLCEFGGDPSVIDIIDLLAFLTHWFAADDQADISGDGAVSVIDLLTFLDCWFPSSQFGCI